MLDPLKILWVIANSTYLVTKFIHVGIADKNDNSLVFDKLLYEAFVDENVELDHTVLTVCAESYNDASHIRYEITSGNDKDVFAVKPWTGDVYVSGVLDYETKHEYELIITASDEVQENDTVVVIHVNDINDHPPVFERQIYRTQITEEDDRHLPKRVLQVTATDGDTSRTQSILYFLTGPGIDPDNPSNSQFHINKLTGEIFVLKPLDRDEPNGRPQWRFTAFAHDEGGEGLVGYADIQINVKDINDNAPFFPENIYFSNVSENGSVGMIVMTIIAVDYDDEAERNNAKIFYSIEKNVIEEDTGLPIFEVEKETGVIKTVVCCLDREKTPDYLIKIVAIDGGGLKGTGTVLIQVTDVNDKPPVFIKDEWFTQVDETDGINIPETPILTVTVHDEDEENQFLYKIVENSGYGADKFTIIRNIDGTGSLKVIKHLDFEDHQQRNGFRFRIQVNDKGEVNDNYKDHVAYSWVNVKLRDINDNIPLFESSSVEVSVPENAEVGKSLATFKASDPDNGGDSKLSFAIDRTTNVKRRFFINQEGTVSIQRQLDREDIAKYELNILVKDNGIPCKTATAILIVTIEDINDNAPVFLKNYQPVILEHVEPQKIIEVLAMDYDDYSNGPPFIFQLDPNANGVITSRFKVVYNKSGANNQGTAVLSSLCSLDREKQKEYLIPILITDSGKPAMTGTSTLTVVVGDINDHKMEPGSKEILVYNYMGQLFDAEIGQVYVNDLDDWDIPDKKFYWSTREHSRFKLNEDTGMITIKPGTPRGQYSLHFKGYDREHSQSDVPATVAVTVKDISSEAVTNAGSVRLSGITDKEFINNWDQHENEKIQSKCERFRDKVAGILKIKQENVNIFSVKSKRKQPQITDVRFFVFSSEYYMPVKLNGLLLLHRQEIEEYVGINITMVGIDECLYENQKCNGSCSNKIEISNTPYMVNANKTALVGVRIDVTAECICSARNFVKKETCRGTPCLNGGRCSENKYGVSCSCPKNYLGPRCQQTTRSFHGNGWAWYPPLEVCENSHLSLEFITLKQDGLLLYNGPITAPELEENIVSDFISLELEYGHPRLLIDFGSGTLELIVNTKYSLGDGEWHRIDILWNTENVEIIVDYCQSGDTLLSDDGHPLNFNSSQCREKGSIPPFNELLNVNTPLQIGGCYDIDFEPSLYSWKVVPHRKGFDGCIRNIFHNSKLYDLANPGFSKHTSTGCSPTEQVCYRQEPDLQSRDNSVCIANMFKARYECLPGFTGSTCSLPTVPATFKSQSYIKYALSFEPDPFFTQIQLRFRTREMYGELFRISDQYNRAYTILEIRNKKLLFRYNLNTIKREEKSVGLNEIKIDDGQWHTVKVLRYGSTVNLELDGGEGRRYNESFSFEGHQWLLVDKQDGVYAGGKAEYTGVKTFEVNADYKKSCLDDIRLDGKQLPIPPAVNGTQWSQATTARNLERDCPSNKACAKINCPEPFECADIWNEYECVCGQGKTVTLNGKECIDKNECLERPCKNGGICVNKEPSIGYLCNCPDGFQGRNCQLIQQEHTMQISMGAVVVFCICLCLIFSVSVIFIICNRRRDAHIKCQKPSDDIRENIITYDDEGGGEDDMTASQNDPSKVPSSEPIRETTFILPNFTIKNEENIRLHIEERKNQEDQNTDIILPNEHLKFDYEGCYSTAGSFSSLSPSTVSNQDFSCLEAWGSAFTGLAKMYNTESDEDNA